jgi:hypothetical protein
MILSARTTEAYSIPSIETKMSKLYRSFQRLLALSTIHHHTIEAENHW